MFTHKLHPFGKSLSGSSSRRRWATALAGARPRPQVEALEDRTLLSAAGQALVAQMYQDLLQRPADASGLASWAAALDHGASPSAVAQNLAQSPEGRALQVQTLYQQFLHRGADPVGLSGATQALAAGQTLEQVAATIVASPEYYQTRAGGSDSGFLDALYQDVFNRPVDAGGAASFGRMLAGGATRAQVAEAIFASPELQQDLVSHDYQYFLHRAADPAGLANWTQALQHGMRDEQIAAAMVGSPEYAQIVQSTGGSLQQTLLPAGGQVDPVLVTNTPAQPVPVAQSGAWTVGISGTVQVASSRSSPVFVSNVNDALQPFQVLLRIPIDPGSSLGEAELPMVPSGKRLVIEYVSGVAVLLPGQRMDAALVTVVNSIAGSHRLTPTFDGSFGGTDRVSFSQLMKVYADAGTKPVMVLTRTDGMGSTTVFVTVSGYLVNVS